MTPTTESIDVTPDSTLLEDIGAASFTLAEAIGELVANSLDARVAPLSPLRVDVTVGAEQILIVDDGKGMTPSVLREAVRLGVKMDRVTGNTGRRKGAYGLGLKTATASLGRHWSIITRPVEGEVDHRVDFDLEAWSARSGDRAFQWRAELHSMARHDAGPLGDRPHGTAIVVRRLRQREPMVGPVLERLGWTYKPNIEGGDQISVNGQVCEPPSYDYFPGSRRDLDLEVKDGGRVIGRITGWVALDKKTHNDDAYGVNLYREGQLIEPWNKSWFRAHLMSSRIIGEVNIDFVKTNYFKRGFETQSHEWELATAIMREQLRELVKASGAMARNKKDPARFGKALKGLARATDTASQVTIGESLDIEEQPRTIRVAEHQTPDAEVVVEVQRDVVRCPDPISLVSDANDLASETTPWAYVFDEEAGELQVVLNTSSRLYERAKDTDIVAMFAVADCLAQFLVARRGMSQQRARTIRDEWLFLAMGGK